MSTEPNEPTGAPNRKTSVTVAPSRRVGWRTFLTVSLALGALILTGTTMLSGAPLAAQGGKKTFTILHTNDMHSAFIGLGPASDYTPFTLNDDQTRGGYARLATLISQRKEARKDQGPVLVLTAGDYSMGTPFGAATRETGGELQLMSLMGFDAVTFGNHEFDLGPDGLGRSISVAARAGRIPAVVASNTGFGAQDAALADLQRLTRDGVIRRYVVIERGGIRFGLFGSRPPGKW
jgi:5'-nucleotidase/UDP-sugar diphosphatase